jgi:hypothetical protein
MSMPKQVSRSQGAENFSALVPQARHLSVEGSKRGFSFQPVEYTRN